MLILGFFAIALKIAPMFSSVPTLITALIINRRFKKQKINAAACVEADSGEDALPE